MQCSEHLPPMLPGFDSEIGHRTWVVILSLVPFLAQMLCLWDLHAVSLPSQKPALSKFHFDWEHIDQQEYSFKGWFGSPGVWISNADL